MKCNLDSSKHYMKVMFGNESHYENNYYKYKIGEINISDNWNPKDNKNAAKQIIKDKVNKDNIDIAIKEYENFYKGYTQEEKDNYNEVLKFLKELKG